MDVGGVASRRFWRRWGELRRDRRHRRLWREQPRHLTAALGRAIPAVTRGHAETRRGPNGTRGRSVARSCRCCSERAGPAYSPAIPVLEVGRCAFGALRRVAVAAPERILFVSRGWSVRLLGRVALAGGEAGVGHGLAWCRVRE